MSYSSLVSNDAQFQKHLHCPQCGAETIVNHGSKYTCLTCKFSRDVAEQKPEPESGGFPSSIIFGTGILLLLLL